jgi:hypothetical protein
MLLSALLLSLGLFFNNVRAQSPVDYFTGKWDVLVTGLPDGDSKMIVILERNEGKLVGTIGAVGLEDSIEIDDVEEKETSVKLYFFAGGYDIFLFLEKKDENHLEGTLLDMFIATGDRIADEN